MILNRQRTSMNFRKHKISMIKNDNKDTRIHRQCRNINIVLSNNFCQVIQVFLVVKFNQVLQVFILPQVYLITIFYQVHQIIIFHKVFLVVMFNQVLHIIILNQVLLVRKDLPMMIFKIQKNKRIFND